MSNSSTLRKSSPLAELLSKIQLEDQRRSALRKTNENKTLEQLLDESRHRCLSLTGFIREAWHVLEPKNEYIHGRHIDLVCEHLEAVTRGEITRLLIEIPPGGMKSLIVSVFFPAWEWAMGFASLRYLCTSYEKTLTDRDNARCKDLIESDWYQKRWPSIELVTAGVYSFQNSATGWRFGAPFGSLIGKRGDRLIIDDPLSVKTSEYRNQLNEVIRLFREGALNRLNSQMHSAMIGIWQRLGPNDLSSVWLDVVPNTVHVMLPMEFERSRACRTAWASDWRTTENELLEPIRFPREAIDGLKQGMTAHAYAAQYQQRPSAREGGMFKREWFANKIIDKLPDGIRHRVRKWDLAASAPEDSADPDFTANLKMSTDGRSYFVEYVNAMQVTPNEVRKAIRDTAALDGPSVHIRIPQDPGQAGVDQAQSIIAENAGFIISAEKETGDKGTRAEPFAAQCEAGNVFLLRGDYVEGFIDQLCQFPKGHDDKVDCASGAFNYLASKPMDSFFNTEKLKVRGFPVPVPTKVDNVFAVVWTSVKTGKEANSAGVVYFARKKFGGCPLTILDWDITSVTGNTLDTWFAGIFGRLNALVLETRAFSNQAFAFLQNKDAGSILFKQAEINRLPVAAIDDEILKPARNERAINTAAYLDRDTVKIAGLALEKRVDLDGSNRNHLIDQIEALRIDDKDTQAAPADLLNCFMLGVALALGNAEGY